MLTSLEEIIFVSAKTGEGFKNIIDYIKSVKREAIAHEHVRYSKHFYVVGFANTGKSSFINKLNRMTSKYSK